MGPYICGMLPEYIHESALDLFIEAALGEDIGDGDHTSLATIPEDARKKARLYIKDRGILAGVELAERIFTKVDPDLVFSAMMEDGQEVKPGDVVFDVYGRARSILASERLVLNCMQRMSGIATHTRELVSMTAGTGTKLLDTRKTTPNFRMMEKWAVRIGGGENHRFGLYDMILIKDNHIDFAGGVGNALQSARDYLNSSGRKLKVEIEARTLEEVDQILESGDVDRILLDNMDPATLKVAVDRINGRATTEASGGITAEDIAKVAGTGVDFISIGALTHSVKSLDMSLKAVD